MNVVKGVPNPSPVLVQIHVRSLISVKIPITKSEILSIADIQKIVLIMN